MVAIGGYGAVGGMRWAGGRGDYGGRWGWLQWIDRGGGVGGRVARGCLQGMGEEGHDYG